jgi:hypothetical protein
MQSVKGWKRGVIDTWLMSGWDTQNYPKLSCGDVFVMSNESYETQVLLTNTNVIHKCAKRRRIKFEKLSDH